MTSKRFTSKRKLEEIWKPIFVSYSLNHGKSWFCCSGKNLRRSGENHSGISRGLLAATRSSFFSFFTKHSFKKAQNYKITQDYKRMQHTQRNQKKNTVVYRWFSFYWFQFQVYNGILISNGETVQNIGHLKVNFPKQFFLSQYNLRFSSF